MHAHSAYACTSTYHTKAQFQITHFFDAYNVRKRNDIYIYIHTHTCIYTHKHTHFVNASKHIYIYIYIYIHTYIYIHANIYIHAYTYIHTHAFVNASIQYASYGMNSIYIISVHVNI